MNIISNELIPVYDNNGDHAVNTRELHEFLEVSSKYADWIKNRISKMGLLENEDYEALSNFLENGGKSVDYIVSVDTAKEIAMMENSDKGREVRRYFIAVEKEFRQRIKPLSTLEMFEMQLEIAKEHNSKINALESKTARLETTVDHIADAMTGTSTIAWTADMNRRINGLCKIHGLNYQTFRSGLYLTLESTARCNIAARKRNLQERMKASGCKYSEIKTVTKLQVVADDPKLRAIFENLVRAQQVKYAGKEQA